MIVSQPYNLNQNKNDFFLIKEARFKKKWFQYYLLLKKEDINVTEIISKSRINPNL